jgi:hypothetical protein
MRCAEVTSCARECARVWWWSGVGGEAAWEKRGGVPFQIELDHVPPGLCIGQRTESAHETPCLLSVPSVFGRSLQREPVRKWTPERNAIGHTPARFKSSEQASEPMASSSVRLLSKNAHRTLRRSHPNQGRRLQYLGGIYGGNGQSSGRSREMLLTTQSSASSEAKA